MRRNLTRAHNTFVVSRKSKGVSGHEIIFLVAMAVAMVMAVAITMAMGGDTGGYGDG